MEEKEQKSKLIYEPRPLSILFSSVFPNSDGKEIKNVPKKVNNQPRENKKSFMPISPTSLQSSILAVQESSRKKTPHKNAFTSASTSKKNWNSSVNVSKKAVPAKQPQTARKVLNFSRSAKVVTNVKKNIVQETAILPKSKIEVPSKPSQKSGKNNIEIPGIQLLPVSPSNGIPKRTDKGYIPLSNITTTQHRTPKANPQKAPVTPKSILRNMSRYVLDSPLPSATKSSDSSFLLHEKEINDIENSKEVVSTNTKNTVEDVASFMQYRCASEFLCNSSADESNCINGTIMSFTNENQSNDDSVTLLTEMLQKATVTDILNATEESEYTKLLQQKQELEEKCRTIRDVIEKAKIEEDKYLKSLQHINEKLKEHDINANIYKRTINNKISINKKRKSFTSPVYKIPKKITFKTSPQTPLIKHNKAYQVYMNIKRNINFLNTPNRTIIDSSDTPSRLSKNLKSQLDKLYSDNSEIK